MLWCCSLSGIAIITTASPNTPSHSASERLLVTSIELRSQRRLPSWKNRCTASASNGPGAWLVLDRQLGLARSMSAASGRPSARARSVASPGSRVARTACRSRARRPPDPASPPGAARQRPAGRAAHAVTRGYPASARELAVLPGVHQHSIVSVSRKVSSVRQGWSSNVSSWLRIGVSVSRGSIGSRASRSPPGLDLLAAPITRTRRVPPRTVPASAARGGSHLPGEKHPANVQQR